MDFVSRRRSGVSSIVGSIFFVLIMVVAAGSLVTMFNSFTSYNQQVNSASSAAAQVADTSLTVSSGQFGAYPPSTTSNFNVATTSCTAGAAGSTAYTNVQKIFYAANMWWNFFYCNGAFQYSTSFDGVHWQTQTNIPSVVTTGYTAGPYFDVEVSGTTIYLAIAEHAADDFQLGIGTLSQGGTVTSPAGAISWQSAPANVATTAAAFGPIQMTVDGAGNVWVGVVQGTCSSTTNCAIGIYERQACSSGVAANDGWEPNACTSATAPTNYAPTAMGNPTANLPENTNLIMQTPPSSLTSGDTPAGTGVFIIYESTTGSTTTPSTAPLAIVTQTALASATWNTISTSGLSDYSLTSSSALMIGTTLFVAGLENTAAGDTTGGVDFWSVAFTSMTAGTVSSQTSIEATAESWQAALTSSGTTIVLFDNPPASVDTCPAADTCIQYYETSTYGSVWSSAILLDSSETAVSGLSPAQTGFAITWTNTAPDVRFAALSSFTVTNNSPFSVHVVDAYVYNPSANTLAAHWYYNSTEDFDYWVGQGSSTVIPLRFIWAASTPYLITFSTDQGATTQTTLTTLPGGTTSCPSGQFFNEISPYDECASATGSTNPYLTSGDQLSTTACEPSTAALWYSGFGMSYTTSASTSGNLYVSYSFQIISVATTATISWQLVYGSGTAPTCEAATGYTGSATAIGEPFTVESQVATASDAREHDQSVSVTLSALAPGTTYWFDIEETPTTASTYTFSNPDLAVTDVLSTNSPTLATSAGTGTCTDATATTTEMMGLGRTFTTPSSGFSGTVFGEYSVSVANAAGVLPYDSAYTIREGTGVAPTCNNGAASGTAVPGNSYTIYSQVDAAGSAAQKVAFVLTGLTAGTVYWVDVESVDTTATGWTYSDPVLTTMSMPTAGTNSLPTATEVSNTNTCTDDTTGSILDAGFALKFNVPSSATGDAFLTLNFQTRTPAAAGATESSTWQAMYQIGGSPPACGANQGAILVGGLYTLNSQSTTSGGYSQTETFVVQNIQRVAGDTIWVDIETVDSTTAEAWVFLNPQLSVAYFPE